MRLGRQENSLHKKIAVGCKTDGERALSNARSLNCVRLEAEDGSAFAAKITPLMRGQTHE